eukprot:TRINITY_DN16_c1_g3_i1.p1 TRINITY_DN16_c1_g3~~TRINITY_DN16_c1_g3_i1.p1  ORF type:complete len:161 (+),score=30.92 TRINITY_DN16_c1_g3_i1:66-548(+)
MALFYMLIVTPLTYARTHTAVQTRRVDEVKAMRTLRDELRIAQDKNKEDWCIHREEIEALQGRIKGLQAKLQAKDVCRHDPCSISLHVLISLSLSLSISQGDVDSSIAALKQEHGKALETLRAQYDKQVVTLEQSLREQEKVWLTSLFPLSLLSLSPLSP